MSQRRLADCIANVAAPGSEHYERARERADRYPEDIRRSLFLHDLSKPLIDYLSENEPFEGGQGFMVATANGYTGFHPREAALAICRMIQGGATTETAARWLFDVIETTEAEGIVILAFRGVRVDSEVELDASTSLLPFEQLPDSSTKDWLGRAADVSELPGLAASTYSQPPASALVRRIQIRPVFYRHDADHPSQSLGLAAHTDLTDAMLALSLCGPSCPVIAGSWFSYLDSSLQSAVLYGGVSSSMDEVVPWFPGEPEKVASDRAAEVVRLMLDAPADIRSAARLALKRFNQAMRRPAHGDRALDLAIALEALLVDDRGDNSFKVALRAALMLEGTVEQRVHARAMFQSLYGIRSAIAHSGECPKEAKVRGDGKLRAAEIVAECSLLTASLLERILRRRQVPDWFEFELACRAKD